MMMKRRRLDWRQRQSPNRLSSVEAKSLAKSDSAYKRINGLKQSERVRASFLSGGTIKSVKRSDGSEDHK